MLGAMHDDDVHYQCQSGSSCSSCSIWEGVAQQGAGTAPSKQALILNTEETHLASLFFNFTTQGVFLFLFEEPKLEKGTNPNFCLDFRLQAAGFFLNIRNLSEVVLNAALLAQEAEPTQKSCHGASV